MTRLIFDEILSAGAQQNLLNDVHSVSDQLAYPQSHQSSLSARKSVHRVSSKDSNKTEKYDLES